MSKKESVQFHQIRPEHRGVHDLLLNWAAWAKPSRHGAKLSPMFKFYRPKVADGDDVAPRESKMIVDVFAAEVMEKRICRLKHSERIAIVWFYVWRNSPSKAARRLQMNFSQLQVTLDNARHGLMASGYWAE